MEALVGTLHAQASIACEAARAGGKILATAFDDPAAASNLVRDLQSKAVADFVTEVDQKSDEAVQRVLKHRTPNFGVMSEEAAAIAGDNNAPTWIVDPLDGTSAFIFRTDRTHPAVLIALQNQGVVELGVVHFPLTGEWFIAAANAGTYYMDGQNAPRKLTPATTEPALARSWIVLNHYGDSAFETESFSSARSSLRSHIGAALVTVVPPHSGIGCRILLENGPAAVIHDNNPLKTKQEWWDVAAVSLIVREAGGSFVDIRGRPYGQTSTGPIIAARVPKIAGELMQHLNRTAISSK